LLNIKYTKGIFLKAIILIFLILVPSTSAAQNIRVSGISLNTQNLTLLWGEEGVLTARLSPRNATDQRIWWTNSNEAVLVVRASGNKAHIRSLAPGETVVTATSADGRYVASCNVTVVKLVTSVGINEDLIQLSPGETFELKAWVEPRDASEQGITWESSDNAVASVNVAGMVQAVRDGEARIIARSLENREISTYTTVRVSAAPLIVISETEEQTEESPFLENSWQDDVFESSDDTPSNLFYILIAILVLASALLVFVLLRRSRKRLPSAVVGVSGPLPVLRGISGLFTGSKFALDTGPIVIGRDQATAQVVYPPQDYDQISRRHLTIYFDPTAGIFFAEDTSSNGTYLSNGDKLPLNQKRALQPGETITLAQTEETFTVELE